MPKEFQFQLQPIEINNYENYISNNKQEKNKCELNISAKTISEAIKCQLLRSLMKGIKVFQHPRKFLLRELENVLLASTSSNRHISNVKTDFTNKNCPSLQIKDQIVGTFLLTSKALISKQKTKSLLSRKHGRQISLLRGLMRQTEFRNQKGALHWVVASTWLTQSLQVKALARILFQR